MNKKIIFRIAIIFFIIIAVVKINSQRSDTQVNDVENKTSLNQSLLDNLQTNKGYEFYYPYAKI